MKNIDQTYEIEAPVANVWQALIDPKIIDEWGGGPAEMKSEAGFTFKLWGGEIHGKNIEVVPNKMLVQERYEIYRYTNIRIIPVNELDDFLGIIAHGNLMFWGKGIPRGMESFEILYCKDILYDNKEIMVVYNDIRTKVKDNPKVEDCLKSVLLNRLPMILYARDMVKFYEIQLDHFKRRGLIGRFSMLLNYHLTYFYLLAWGMLDHLTLLINLVKDYKFKDRDCGIRIKQYLEVLEKDMPKTSALINKESKWIDVIADMRHHAAHKTIALVNDIYQETDESQKTDEEVMEFLKREEPYFFQYLPKELVDKMLPEKIFNWKFRHLKVILPNAAMIKLNDKDCMIFPTIDIDFNVIKVKEILALVLSELFP